MEKISEGQELTVSYVDFLNLSADRQKKLKEHFHFECTCEHCSKHIKDDLMAALADSKVRKGGCLISVKMTNCFSDINDYNAEYSSLLPAVC